MPEAQQAGQRDLQVAAVVKEVMRVFDSTPVGKYLAERMAKETAVAERAEKYAEKFGAAVRQVHSENAHRGVYLSYPECVERAKARLRG